MNTQMISRFLFENLNNFLDPKSLLEENLNFKNPKAGFVPIFKHL
jgi:hypothetical protein